MAPIKDTYCSYCATPYPPPLAYPRTCANPACSVTVWSNPIPVAVALVPIVRQGRTGLLVVRRGIEPRRGLLALVGGFMEAHERWEEAAAREVREEAGVIIDPARVEMHWIASSQPRPDRLLVFCTVPPIDANDLPPLTPNHETLERGVVFGPDGLDAVFAFALHAEAARRWFATHGAHGAHDFAPV